MRLAVIFTSGSGRRLAPLTNEVHKSLIKINNIPIIENIINNLLLLNNLEKIIIVTGYKKDSFNYLINKYHNVEIINNDFYTQYESGYALTLIKNYFDKYESIFLISGDFVMLENCFKNDIKDNFMAGMKNNHKKNDWRYELNSQGNIINLVKNDNTQQYLASEWTHISQNWAKILAHDLNNSLVNQKLKTIILGKYLIKHAQENKINLKPYILNFDKFWDLDDENDLQRIINN